MSITKQAVRNPEQIYSNPISLLP